MHHARQDANARFVPNGAISSAHVKKTSSGIKNQHLEDHAWDTWNYDLSVSHYLLHPRHLFLCLWRVLSISRIVSCFSFACDPINAFSNPSISIPPPSCCYFTIYHAVHSCFLHLSKPFSLYNRFPGPTPYPTSMMNNLPQTMS